MLILRWIINALALLVIARYLPGFAIASTFTALVLVIILGLINAVIRPVILLLTLPVNILT
ncbi:MAG: phage holin family protein, partial [bacterium]|nr:phage holin family protein [bacterium]